MVVRELITTLGFKVDTAKFRAFDRRLGQSMAKVDKYTMNIRKMATSLRNTSAMLTIAITAPITLLGIRALKTSSNLEQMKVAFETMLGSAEKADKLIKDLLTFAAKTPFQITDVQQNSKLLLGMGIAADKIIPTMNALGNVASGLSVPIERIAMNYGQVRTQTKLLGTELRDFARAGIPIIQQLAEQLGVTESAVKGLVTEGAISFDMVEKAFMDMSGEGGRFFNLMQKQSKTLGGRWSNLMDIITIFGAEFGNMIEETFNLKENMRRLTSVIEVFTIRIKNASPFVRKTLVLFISLVAVLPVLLLLISSLALGILGITAALVALKPVFAVLGTVGAAGLGIILLKVLAVIAILMALGAAIYVVYDDMRTWITGGDSLIGKLLGSFTNFYNKVTFFFSLIGEMFSSFWKAMTQGDQEAWNKFKILFSQIFSMVSGFISSINNVVWRTINKLVELGVGVAKNIGKKLLDIGLQIAKTAFNIVKNFIGFVIGDIINTIDKLAYSIRDKFNSVFTKAFPKFTKFLGNITSSDYIDGLSNNSTQPKTTFKPGVLAGAGTAGTSSKEININSKVDVTVPEGTTLEQERFLQESANTIFDKKMDHLLSNAINANRQVE